MKHFLNSFYILIILIICSMSSTSWATKLIEVKILDKDYLMVYFKDGEVTFRDDGLGSSAFTSDHENDNDTVKTYGSPLNTTNAVNIENWILKSPDDPNYRANGLNPTDCYRKSKLNGMAENVWSGNDYTYEYTMEHNIFLNFPHSMVQGISYILEINSNTNSDETSETFTFDIFNSLSEAIHVNLIGYKSNNTIKAADLYMWMGDGGIRDYSDFEGNNVYIYDVNSQESEKVGNVSFWKASAEEAQGYNLVGSDVWNADFSGFYKTGTYRIAIEGVGCSRDFRIDDNLYFEPFKVSVKGFFYMRIGQDSTGEIRPVPRRPLWIPGKNPSSTTVLLTTMHPFHEEWSSFSSGPWDSPNDWEPYIKSGSSTNPNAWGGHSDALDWDRHLAHVSNIYDMLLPFFLTNGAIDNDNLGIAESGNNIPDILDEARFEVDFWLRVRDDQGYSHGLTNPNKSNVLYQAGTTAIAAWANAANCAMLADCFRIEDLTELMNEYGDSAIAAYNYAGNLSDMMLDEKYNIGETYIGGRDLKMMAAAFLYNVTGESHYEDVINSESVCTNVTSELDDFEAVNQTWATAAYLLTNRTVNYPALYDNMKKSIIYQAKKKEADYSDSRPSRRATDNSTGYFQTIQNVQRTLIAHAVADNQADKDLFHNAMVLEADWGLGRNPLNIIQMTTATTSMESKPSVENIYTSGRDDGSPGLHPGHTPYLNTDDWACSMIMGCPSWLYSKGYPEDFSLWPKASAYFNARYVWAHSEFTPRQTMRGKTALYGYLYGMDLSETGINIRNGNPRSKSNKKAFSLTIDNCTVMLPYCTGTYSVSIIDISGRTIWSDKIKIESNKFLKKCVPQKNGLYILNIRGNNQSINRKLLKLR